MAIKRPTPEMLEEIRKEWGAVKAFKELLAEIDGLREEHDELFLELGKYSDVPSFEFWKDKYDQLRAENLSMREALEKISNGRDTYFIDQHGLRETAKNVLSLPHTARLAKRLELMERVVEAARYFSNYNRMSPILKEFDTLEKE